MNERQSFFLDTTIQIDRLFEIPDRKRRIRDTIAGRLLVRFGNVLSEPESDLTRCEIARHEVQESDGIFELEVHCNRRRAKCDLPKIYQDNEKHLKCIRKLVEGNCTLKAKEQRELETINKMYSKVQRRGDWSIVKGERNCDELSDLTILIESPPGFAVYTTDKHYELLFSLLDFPEKKAPKIERYDKL